MVLEDSITGSKEGDKAETKVSSLLLAHLTLEGVEDRRREEESVRLLEEDRQKCF